MKHMFGLLALALVLHNGVSSASVVCPGAVDPSCSAFTSLEIEVTSGKCVGTARADCRAVQESQDQFKKSLEEWWAEDGVCDSGKAEVAVESIATAIAKVWSNAAAKVDCSGQGFACGWAISNGNSYAVAFAEAIAQAAAEAGSGTVAEGFCFADIRAVTGVFAEAAAGAQAETCSFGGAAEDFERSYVEAVKNGIASAFAKATASACDDSGEVEASSECFGEARTSARKSITRNGDVCGGVQELNVCVGAVLEKCCAADFRRNMCTCRDCNGPWFKKSQRGAAKKAFGNRSGELCFCADTADGSPEKEKYSPEEPEVFISDEETYQQEVTHLETPEAPEVVHEQEPEAPEVTHEEAPEEPEAIHEQEPEAPKVTHDETPEDPEVIQKQAPEEPEVTHKQEPEVTHKQAPEVTHKQAPEEIDVIHTLITETPEIFHQQVSEEAHVIHEETSKEPEVLHEEAPEEPEVVHEETPEEPEVVHEEAPEEPVVIHEEAPEEPEVVHEEAPEEPVVIHEEAPEEPQVVHEETPEEPEVIHEEAPEEPTAISEEIPKEASEPKKTRVFGARATVTCPGASDTTCSAFSSLEILVTSGSCKGTASADCKSVSESKSDFKESFDEWWGLEGVCDSGKAEAAASAVAKAIAKVWANAAVKVTCDGMGFACGWSVANGQAWSIAFAEAIAQAAAEVGTGTEAAGFCFADLRSLSSVIAEAASKAQADACSSGGTVEDFENSYAASIQSAIATAFAKATAEACNADGKVIASSECTGVGESVTQGEVFASGDACAGLEQIKTCAGPGVADCCSTGFRRRLCNCSRSGCKHGPWVRKSDFNEDNNTLRSFEDRRGNVCFCSGDY